MSTGRGPEPGGVASAARGRGRDTRGKVLGASETAEERARREELREICDRRLSRRGGLKHLQWEGDCGLYGASDTEVEDESRGNRTLIAPASPQRMRYLEVSTPPSPPPPGPAYLVGDQVLVTATHAERMMGYPRQRARRLSDPGPALVAEWLAGVAAS